MERRCFWSEALTFRGSVTPMVLRRVGIFGLIGFAMWAIHLVIPWHSGMTVTPFEFVGAILGLLLVLRTNSGYDRWYEARKLWGGIVNQSRNLAINGLSYGPRDERWRQDFIRWTAAFPHITRHSLRGERNLSDAADLLTSEELKQVAAAEHMPMYASARVSQMLHEAVQSGEMDRFAFINAERERAQLIDHLGACERILKTPLASAFSVEIRRFILVYLVMLPLALIDQVGALTPLFIMLVAYPLLSLDQIGVDLQNPFSRMRLSHLPLDEISMTIEGNLVAMVNRPLVDDPVSESSEPDLREVSADDRPPSRSQHRKPAPVFAEG